MALGSRIGSRTSFLGSVVGSAADDEGTPSVAPSFSVDAGSNIAVPASATEWAAFITAKGLTTVSPDSLWLCQEASGNLADSIGSTVLVAANTPSYQTPVSGWSRVGVSMTEGAVARFSAVADVGPSIATTSVLWLTYALMPGSLPAAKRQIMVAGGAANTTDVCAVLSAAGKATVRCVNVETAGASVMTNVVHPIVLAYNRTAGTVKTYTLQDKVVGTYNASPTDGNKGLGMGVGTSPACTYLYACCFSGANAEMTDAQVKSLLTALGFAIPWS